MLIPDEVARLRAPDSPLVLDGCELDSGRPFGRGLAERPAGADGADRTLTGSVRSGASFWLIDDVIGCLAGLEDATAGSDWIRVVGLNVTFCHSLKAE